MSLATDPVKWWKSLSDEDKQQALDTLGELAGGTVGAIAGGGTPASIPGAGAGAVVGRAASREIGKRVLGLKSKENTPAEELAATGATFAANAAGEGAGQAATVAYRGVKSLAKRALQKGFKPNKEVIGLAQKANVPLTPGMLSDNPLVKFAESGLEKLPGGTGVIRKKTVEAVAPWEKSVRDIPRQFHPSAVTDVEAGTALAEQLAANRAASSAHYSPKYKQIIADAGDAPIEATEFRGTARQFLESLPQKMESFFPTNALRKLKQAAGLPDGQMTPSGLIDGPVPVMTFAEAQELRTGLLEAERAMSSGDAAVHRRTIPALRDALDRAIDDSLSGSANPAHSKALTDWRAVNQRYGQTQSALYPHGKTGNPAAGTIDRADLPEQLLSLGNKPSAITETGRAVKPMFGAQDYSAMPKFRRNRADDLIDRSQTQNRFISDERVINPRRMEKLMDTEAAQTLYGPGPYRELEDAVRLGKAVTSPTNLTNVSDTARHNMLINLGVLGAGGVAGATLSGGEGLLDTAQDVGKGVLTAYAIPKLAAKAWTSKPFVNALSTSPPPVLSIPSGRLSQILGGSARGIMRMQKLPEANEEVRRYTMADFQQ